MDIRPAVDIVVVALVEAGCVGSVGQRRYHSSGGTA